MNFTVVWRWPATNALAAAVVAALEAGDGSGAIAAAAARVDDLLRRDAAHAGESRPNRERVVIDSPLTVFFEVHDEERVVVVLSVRVFGHR
jgi:hypothetical protein